MAQERSGLLRLQGAAVLAVVLAAHLSLAPNLADPDAFYHLGHAAHYAQNGLFDTSFPWATTSVIRDLGGDLWWGFHMTLLPFTAFSDVAGGIRVASFLLTLVLAAAVWWLLSRHRVPGPGWWTALFLLAVPNVLYRYLMVRPHVLSLALALTLVSLLVRGRWWQALGVSAAMTWLHLSLFWMAPGIAAAYALVRLGARRSARNDDGGREAAIPVLHAVGAVFAGTALGALLRPHPFATTQLAWVQIVRLFAEKATDRPLVFATELLPLPLSELVRSAWSFLLIWPVAGLAAWAWRRDADREGTLRMAAPERRLLAVSSLIAAGFLALTVLSARRALVEFVAFGFLLLPLSWSFLVPAAARRRVLPALAIFLAGHLVWAGQRHLLNSRVVALPPDAMAEAATWLAVNAEPGDVVFHAHWDNFGPLFAHNRASRYLGGMDPIFQYAHDPGLYWEHFFLSADLVVEYTCDAFPCYEGEATATGPAIRDHFHARWVLVEPARNPKLTRQLLGDRMFELVLETRHEAIFKVLEPDDPPPPNANAGATPGEPR